MIKQIIKHIVSGDKLLKDIQKSGGVSVCLCMNKLVLRYAKQYKTSLSQEEIGQLKVTRKNVVKCFEI